MSRHCQVCSVLPEISPPFRFLRDIDISRFYLSAARLHLHAFYLFDEPSVNGYADRIVTLYQTARSLIEQGLEMDEQEQGFFHYCPFFSYQVFVSASFILLKILVNGYFESLLDIEAGKKLLNATISALRKMSVANNDLPGRLSDVVAYFYTLPKPRVISGETIDGLQLKVRNRLTMSIVYDFLWEWRKHFQIGEQDKNLNHDHQDKYHAIGMHSHLANVDSLHLLFSDTDDIQNVFAFDYLSGLTDGFTLEWPG
jgi:transcriptional regulatory protein LEU3